MFLSPFLVKTIFHLLFINVYLCSSVAKLYISVYQRLSAVKMLNFMHLSVFIRGFS